MVQATPTSTRSYRTTTIQTSRATPTPTGLTSRLCTGPSNGSTIRKRLNPSIYLSLCHGPSTREAALKEGDRPAFVEHNVVLRWRDVRIRNHGESACEIHVTT